MTIPDSHSGETVLEFIDRNASHWRPYGSGKVALRDGLRALQDRGSIVLLPALLPDALVEPIHEAGFRPQFYDVTSGLSPDRMDLQDRLGDETAAVMVIEYFGFPCSNLGQYEQLCADTGAMLIEDAAHGPVSTDTSGRLLGSRAPMGFTSLPKVLPVPNGGLLYSDQSLVIPESDESGVQPRYSVPDWKFLLINCIPRHYREGSGKFRTQIPPPEQRYAAVKEPLSRLTYTGLQTTPVAKIRGRRRSNYRAWLTLLADHDGIDPIFSTLPPGVCPLGLPILTDDPDTLIDRLIAEGIDGSYRWPRLPSMVRDRPSESLVDELAVLPVDTSHSPREITSVALG